MDDLTAPGSQEMPETADKGGEPPPGLALEAAHDAGDWSALAPANRELELVAAACAREVGFAIPTVAVVAWSSDERLRVLNRTYRGEDKPTNVLSFAAGGNGATRPDGTAFLGDIVLAAETVRREAREKNIAGPDHVRHLVVHGLLHLLAFDHESDSQAAVMEALETRILARLGVATPYAEAVSSVQV